MDNYLIAEQFSLLAKLLDIHGENSFKSKSYSSAAFTIEKLEQPLAGLDEKKLFAIRGIGESVGKKILEITTTGNMVALSDLLTKTPPGVLEMTNVKGLGAKKIHILWKEMNIDTLDSLRTACIENRVAEKKGFGEKTQQNILDSIDFQTENAGKYLYAKIESFAEALDLKLKEKFPEELFQISGTYARQWDVIESLDWVTTVKAPALKKFLITDSIQLITDRDGLLVFSAEDSLMLSFHLTSEEHFDWTVARTSSSEEFFNAWMKKHSLQETDPIATRTTYLHRLQHIPAALRERTDDAALEPDHLKDLIETHDIKGLIHSHSVWSDGVYTIEKMAEELIASGFEYLVISDHSKAAFYANGLSEQRIKEQHQLIDRLNTELAPFRIYKSIECDILSNGELDYSDEMLSRFDLVITSIHSNLSMDQNKAMKRLLGAVTNPYTTILGHMTGRLLLRRAGYPVDHKTVIDACADHKVVIEINANPNRLDMDWRWIHYAREKGVLLSVNPDAHSTEEFPNIKYGVLVARKGGLLKSENLSSFTRKQFDSFLETQKSKR